MRRIERLINLIAALLESSRPLTADQIRNQIAGYDQPSSEAFRRAFERDKDALRSMGIPLETVPTGPFGDEPDGYTIEKEKYYLPELDLAADELAALRLAAGTLIGAGSQAEAGLLKLSVDASSGEWTTPRIVWGADLNAEQPLLGPLYTAVSERHPILFEYRTGEGDARRREVEPYGLVHRRGNWYLVGRDREREAVRAFKVSRLTAAPTRLDGSYSVPADFDAEAHLGKQAWEIGDDPTTATLRFAAELAWWAEQNLSPERTQRRADGSLDVDVPVANLDALVSWVISFGGRVRIVSPDEARRALVERVSAFAGAARA